MGESNKGKLKNLSIEKKLATALGASFVALVLGAIAQTQNASGTTGSNEYGLTNYPTMINPSRGRFESSPSRGMTQKYARIPLSNDISQGMSSADGKEKQTPKSTKPSSENARVDHLYDD